MTVRIEKGKDYITMPTYHLFDNNLSNKSRGLLSMMLALPDDWDFTLQNLAGVCKDNVDSIRTQIKELEAVGYVVRTRMRDEHGRVGASQYEIYPIPRSLIVRSIKNPTGGVVS